MAPKREKKRSAIPRMPQGLRPIIRQNWKRADRAVTAALDELGEERGPSALHGVDIDLDRLGTGMWGVIYPTTSERWVVKFTADPTEGPITAAIMDDPKLRNHPGISYFAGLWRARGKAKRGKQRNTVFVILREDIEPRGVIEDEELTEREIAIEDLMADDMRDTAEDLNVALLEDDEDEAVAAATSFGEILSQLEDEPETADMANFMEEFFDRAGGALADVHLENVGYREHDLKDLDVPQSVKRTHVPDGSWIIYDPGHSSIEAAYRIPMIRNARRRRT
jgi:hypothetical protein